MLAIDNADLIFNISGFGHFSYLRKSLGKVKTQLAIASFYWAEISLFKFNVVDHSINQVS